MAKGRTPAEQRKLQNMLNDLYVLKAELLPDETNKEADLGKGADDFSKKKHALNALLSRLRTDIQRLNDMRAKLGKNERDTNTIRLSSDNTRLLQEALDKLNDLKQQLVKDEKRKLGRKKLTEEEIADRRHMLYLLAEELKELTAQNCRGGDAVMTDDDRMIEARVERQRQRDEERRKRREEARRNRKGGKKKVDDEDFSDAVTTGQQSEQEQIFEQKVAENVAIQDEMLVQIGNAVDELKELATEMNKHLTIQKAMLEQVDEKMDKNIASFKSANQRMKALLDESGGMTRWCPILICLVFLLAAVGYIFKIV